MQRVTVAAVVTAATLGIGGVALAHTQQFRADPTGAAEVPPNDSSAEADFKLKISHDSARFDLKITEPITDAHMAHLHLGPAGQNGPVVVWLYPHETRSPQPIEGEFEGRLDKGTITVDDLVGPLVGEWDAFVAAAEAGNLYVNVHTLNNVPGEIRAQVETHP